MYIKKPDHQLDPFQSKTHIEKLIDKPSDEEDGKNFIQLSIHLALGILSHFIDNMSFLSLKIPRILP